jgi:AraC-like DNA-binding protein
MIEILKGIHETVNFTNNRSIMLYDNHEYEDYPPHWHTPIEIIMPTQSTYHVDCSNISFHLNEGDILLIAPGVLHNLYAPPIGKRLIFQVGFSLLDTIGELESIILLISPAILITPENAPDIHQQLFDLMLNIRDEYFSTAILKEAYIYSKLIEILVLIGRRHTEKNTIFNIKNIKRKEYIEKILFICDYINNHCTENITLDDMAKLAGFSKYHFSRLFTEFMNVSFYKYLNQRRIMYAEKLLINPNLSITEIAHTSGFSNLSTFIRMFKICKNCTPTNFRNMYKL